MLFLALGASFFFQARVSEMFALSKNAMHVEHGLRRGDVALFKRAVQMSVGLWHLADRVELRFWSSKGDQLRKGKVLTRVRKHAPQVFEAGGGAVDLMIELLSCFRSLPSNAPSVAFGVDGGSWAMWTKHHAESALRQVVSFAGLQPSEYALHSLRIGGATHLAAGGASPEDLRREGRWAGLTGYRPYVRSHRRDAQRISGVLVECVH